MLNNIKECKVNIKQVMRKVDIDVWENDITDYIYCGQCSNCKTQKRGVGVTTKVKLKRGDTLVM